MKSAYIITMHCPLNYGAILQTYALQTYLESLGLKVGVIDYRPGYIVYDQSLMYVGDERLNKTFFTRWAYRLIKLPFKLHNRKLFAVFAKNELHLTPSFKTFDEIKDAGLDADFFFCGSDQIWNIVSGAHKDPSYFLSFVPNGRIKISYAASGNLPLTKDVMNITFPMINKIDFISMREDSTIATIQSFIDKPITHVCDPVFLLDGEDWRKLYKKHSSYKANERYVLVYPMGNGVESTIEKAYQIAQTLGLPLYKISNSQRKDFRVDKQYCVSPYDFLALIDGAECIVTNSFHGTSFSIILEKQFWTCVAEGSNQRIISLLGKAGLERRLLNKLSSCCNDVIDFSTSKTRIESYILQSKQFINNCITKY